MRPPDEPALLPDEDLREVLGHVPGGHEGREPGPTGWGGSNTIGGSPREGGSRLPPDEVEQIIAAAVSGFA